MVARTLPITLAIASCVAFTTPAAPQGLLDFFKSILPAQTFEHVRTKTKQGYGAQVHGKIKISGKSFDFVSGGRGRGSAPFGTYRVGTLSGFKAPRGTWVPGYRLSDAYDPFVKDTRRGLFIHPGHRGFRWLFSDTEGGMACVRQGHAIGCPGWRKSSDQPRAGKRTYTGARRLNITFRLACSLLGLRKVRLHLDAWIGAFPARGKNDYVSGRLSIGIPRHIIPGIIPASYGLDQHN